MKVTGRKNQIFSLSFIFVILVMACNNSTSPIVDAGSLDTVSTSSVNEDSGNNSPLGELPIRFRAKDSNVLLYLTLTTYNDGAFSGDWVSRMTRLEDGGYAMDEWEDCLILYDSSGPTLTTVNTPLRDDSVRVPFNVLRNENNLLLLTSKDFMSTDTLIQEK